MVIVPKWESLCVEAERHVGTDCDLESLFTEDELRENSAAVRKLNAEYAALNRLDRMDVAISAFAALTSAAMVSEVIVRLGYAIKRIKEGNSIRASIPISLNREKHPKLTTMLFIAHAGATAANAGKIYFTKNPMAINYPQWLAFAKYSYSQLKWVIINKPEAQNAYVMGKLNDELFSVIDSTNEMFEDFTKDYIVVFE